MNAQEFLESNEYTDITIRGETYVISRRNGENWIVYSHVDMDMPAIEYVEFADAQREFVRLEREERG